jgi:hypothetical protein
VYVNVASICKIGFCFWRGSSLNGPQAVEKFTAALIMTIYFQVISEVVVFLKTRAFLFPLVFKKSNPKLLAAQTKVLGPVF